jgi:hypothetical protein
MIREVSSSGSGSQERQQLSSSKVMTNVIILSFLCVQSCLSMNFNQLESCSYKELLTMFLLVKKCAPFNIMYTYTHMYIQICLQTNVHI